jgi:hypothetical protein
LDEFRDTPAKRSLYDIDDVVDIDDIRTSNPSRIPKDFPGYVHVRDSKLGGWPSWVHYVEWPQDHPAEQVSLVAQLDHLSDSSE